MKRTAAILLLGLVALGGCRNESAGPSTSSYMKKKAAILTKAEAGKKAASAKPGKGAAAKKKASASESEPKPTYAYSPIGKRDPFRSYVLERKKKQADNKRGPLEQFDLNQLTVVAVVWDTDDPRALITDPGGRGYVVEHGSAIGKNEGRVIEIGDNLVLVTETYVDYLGDRTSKDIEMRIRRK